jgi:hypothetical protein
MTAHFRYDQFVEDALRSVVRRTLDRVAEAGLPGNHHLYITFNTLHSGVEIPPYLAAQYPGEMTIVLQHQFWGLEVDDSYFAVTLSFNKMHERLKVPYVAITSFADPSVNFGLQFKASEAGATSRPATLPAPAAEKLAPSTEALSIGEGRGERGKPAAESASGNDDKVVTLDAFRKK